MKIYDEQILKVLNLMSKSKDKNLQVEESLWEDVGKNNLVLRGEMAYELGGGSLPAISFLGVTSSEDLVPIDKLMLYGNDLKEITSDTPYARITLLRINDELIGTGEELYDIMRDFTNIRYKVNPKGFMSRISTSSNHEPVRISKKALEEGLNFSKVGSLFYKAYKSYEQILSTQIIFVTLTDFDYNQLSKLTQRNYEITKALDHILRDVKMDCSSCKLQTICNEVDGMKDMHFK